MPLIILLTVLLMVIIPFFKIGSNGASDDWSYDDQKEWRSKFATCGSSRQSPVAICNENVVLDEDIPPLQFQGYYNTFQSLNVTNNGHTIVVKKPAQPAASVSGGRLPGKYNFHSLHFHWGRSTGCGSEHTICHAGYGSEMHMVHVLDGLDFNTALTNPHGLLVLGTFFETSESEDNLALSSIVDAVNRVASGQTVSITGNLSLRSLMPLDLGNFYNYNGSLTTPPCSEAVVWVVFNNPSFISVSQLNKFRSAKISPQKNIDDNARESQPLNDRKIFIRRKMKYKIPSEGTPSSATLDSASKYFLTILAASVTAYLHIMSRS